MTKNIFFNRITLRRLTGLALASVIAFGGGMPVWATNDIISEDNTAPEHSGSGSGTDDVNTDNYNNFIQDLVTTGTEKNRPWTDVIDRSLIGDKNYFVETRKFPVEYFGDTYQWKSYITEYDVRDMDWTTSENPPERASTSVNPLDKKTPYLPLRNVDTIEVVDLSHQKESECYPIFRPDWGVFTENNYINNEEYIDGWRGGGYMQIYRPWFDPDRKDTVVYSEEFKDYCEETEETVVVESANTAVRIEKNLMQLGANTGRYQAILTKKRTGEQVTVETLVVPDGETPCVTFSGLPDGEYTVTWWSEHTGYWYTYEKWYTEIFAYMEETRRAVLSYTNYWERKSDYEYCESHWVKDEIQSYSFTSKNGADITVGDGGEVARWHFTK